MSAVVRKSSSAPPIASLPTTCGSRARKTAEIKRLPRIPSTVAGADYVRVVRAALEAATPGMTHYGRCCALAARFGGSPDTMDRLLQGRTQRIQAEYVLGALALARACGVDVLAIPGVRDVLHAITGVRL